LVSGIFRAVAPYFVAGLCLSTHYHVTVCSKSVSYRALQQHTCSSISQNANRVEIDIDVISLYRQV